MASKAAYYVALFDILMFIPKNVFPHLVYGTRSIRFFFLLAYEVLEDYLISNIKVTLLDIIHIHHSFLFLSPQQHRPEIVTTQIALSSLIVLQ